MTKKMTEGMMSIGWGIIGIGGHANRFMAPALSRAVGTRLVAVASRDIGRAEAFAIKHGALRAYDSLEKLLADPEVDVLYIATPNNLHCEETIMAARAGKHVYCEKPMALTVADGEGMIKACKDNGVKLGIDFQNRFHPAHVEARRLILSGEAGEVNVIKAQYAHGRSRNAPRGTGWRNNPDVAGAGSLVGTGVHPVDLCRFLLDSEIAEIRALTDEAPPGRPVDDMAYIIMRFRNGVTGVVISGVLVPRSDDDAVIYGSRMKITCRNTVGMPLRGELIIEGDALNRRESYPAADPIPGLYIKAVEAFNKCIINDTPPPASGEDGLTMIRVVDAVLASSRTGKAVTLEG
jgi:1,5-anhydro-D-fructose reductase (1,5-anhydro-D-mannitol-forming)